MRRQGRQRGAEKDLFYPPTSGFGYPVAHGLGKDARQVGQYGRVQVLRFDTHIACQTDEIFKAERVFRRHQLQHIQTVGADGLVDKNPFGTDGRRNAGADGFAAGIRVGRVDGERVAVAENGGVYVAELFQFGKVIFMPAGVYAPNFSFGIAAGDVFAVLKNNVRR